MKLILRADVDKLGRLGEIVEVKPGFGRNYLVPQGYAMLATKANMRAFELERKKLQASMDALKAAAQELADKLNAAKLAIEVRVGENDKLYGSVTTANIGDALDAMGINVDRRKIVLDDPIRTLGEYTLDVKLHPDVVAELSVAVIRHGQSVEEPVAKEEAVAEDAVEEEE
ncbi:MAG TPA: 50S ribosomal protein L9 [Desulfomicrobiaceae bacterium]|jgi:large subunit ribosomal protein L9|nr:50S ribosomal protein L9 [Desulfomicrobiaceae bacterium]